MRTRYLACALGAVLFAGSAGLASAADEVVVAAPTWSGVYIGGFGGGAWGTTSSPSPYSPDVSGGLGGIRGGADFEIGNGIVLGGIVDYAWGDISGNDSDIFAIASQKFDSMGTLRARLGFDSGAFLPYVTGGYAWAHGERGFNIGFGPVTDTANHSGWTAGAGIEWRMMDNWTLDAEYLYTDLGRETYNLLVPVSVGAQIHSVTVGVNYRF